WLEEGIATYMEGYQFRRDDTGPRFEPRRNWERARALGEALRRDRAIPLPELLRRSPQSFLAEGKDDLLTYYAQVWALVRFLTESENGRYRDALAAVLTDAAHGTLFSRLRRSPAVIARGGQRAMMGGRDGPWVILAYFTTDIATFNQEYMEFARSIAR
ncbi:MAG: hypothetical protein KJO43_00135, partial [Phycisphaerae bacterium]|nr:hypothetical protein [Phycisphaerae bacterium]